MILDLASGSFADRVRGCWLGKNVGGTLGGPLEEARGRRELFDVWWYPVLKEGGMPNDDLEMQLVWLKALEEVGPGLGARDLAQYWLDHIGYNFDEYGLSKTNLRLGLEPPVSGGYNNWFKDCEGCPIRSEIWACVTPGHPRLAARYAYEDAICDHAGGESVYGEMFHAAIQSSAFVEPDRDRLIAIGMSYVPEESKTAEAIRAALKARENGLGWQEARNFVLDTTPHYNAQYSPVNLGFEVVGWLYGDDFADGVCKAVNCGYDTDCTGGTLGAILGIILGASGLPARWTEPMGEEVATNEGWGGLRHVSDGANPIPSTLGELTPRVITMARRVLGHHGLLSGESELAVDLGELEADDAVRALWGRSPMRVERRGEAADVVIDYGDTPAVTARSVKKVVTSLRNRRADPLEVKASVAVPDGWAPPPAQEATVPPGKEAELCWDLVIPAREALGNSNRLFLNLSIEGRPQQAAEPIVFVGAAAYRVSGPYPLDGLSGDEALARAFAPESVSGDSLAPGGRSGEWRELAAPGNAIPLDEVFAGPGPAYLQTFLQAPEAMEVHLGAEASSPARVWVNGEEAITAPVGHPIRPNYAGDDIHYRDVRLEAGWNEVLIKLVWDGEGPRPECHLLVSQAGDLLDGLPSIGRTRFPWD